MARVLLLALIATCGCTFELADVVARDAGAGGSTDAPDVAPIEASCSPDLNTDSNHCGRCDHSCLNGACVLGVCQAVNLAVGQSGPAGIAVDDSKVYWANGGAGTIVRANKDGTAPGFVVQYQTDPLSIALFDAALVYTSIPDKRISLIGTALDSMPRTVASNQAVSWGYVAIDATNVYWTDPTANAVLRAPRAGGAAVTVLAGEPAPHSVIASDGFLYFTTGAGELVRVLPTGMERTVLASGLGQPTHLARLAPYVFVTDSTSRTVTRIGDDRSVVVVATGQNDAHGIVADTEAVYWASSALMRLTRDSTTASAFYEGPQAHRLAVDGAALYWTDFSGNVMRKAK